MAVTTDFTSSELDLNGMASIGGPTALVWGPDGRLYVTEVTGDVNVLTVAFGDKNPNDSENTAQFYVTDAITLSGVTQIQNHNDDGTENSTVKRQVTGIDVTKQFDANGDQVFIDGKAAVVIYVTSSDSRIGAGGGGGDTGLDTNSGVITRMVQQPDGSFVTVDLVRGLTRSEENHATNGLEVIQEIDPDTGKLLSERLIVANGGNANTGAPSNNFAGQQEQPYSAAILEVDLDQLNGMDILDDDGRAYIYDLPTLDDPTRPGADDGGSDPFGGNDGLNSAKTTFDSPVQIYSPGYRNAFDVEVTEDGRVFTYDNGANNNWGGRPAGEDSDGDVNAQETAEYAGTPDGYIATNLFVEDNNEIEGNFNPANYDGLHEVTRSDDLGARELSAGLGGATTYIWQHPDFGPLELVYGGHPNPTRAEGARAGILYSPNNGTAAAKLMVSNEAKDDGTGGTTSDFLEVVDWLTSIGYGDAFINEYVVAVDPGVRYSATFATGYGPTNETPSGRPSTVGVYSLEEDVAGPIGLPSDINTVVHALNPIEGDYREAGFTDGSIDTNKGSVNGLAEYTSTILDDAANGIKMSGALWASTFNGTYLLIGRDQDGIVQTSTAQGSNEATRTVAADKKTIQSDGGPLGLSAIGDDLTSFGGEKAFQGTVWAAIYKQNGPVIEIFQPGNPETNALLPVYAGQEPSDPTDNDLDGINHLDDPFDYSANNGYALASGEALVLDFVLNPPNPDFSGSLGDTGLFGAALDGTTPNRDALTQEDGFTDPSVFQDGLFDNGGNLIIGANAPKTQIKVVKDGTAVGATNDLRDALQTGVKIADDVQRLVADIEIVNWTADQAPEGGRVTGMMFGDGTQSNFVRFFFGDIGGGVLGLEVGMEIDDVYTVLGTATDSAFTTALTGFDPNDAQEKTLFGQKVVNLQLEIADIGGDYDIIARYQVAGETTFQTVTLTNGTLPAESTLRAVLDGTHQISDSDSTPTTATSGAAIGLFAEKDNGTEFTAVDFNEIRVEAFGNEIAATDAAGVGAAGTDGLDTVIYTGTQTDLAPLADDVENFDGSGSAAAYDVTANANDNTIKVGAGTNTITTGSGADKVMGTKADLNTDVITDFSVTDKVVISDATLADTAGIEYEAGSAIVKLNGVQIEFSGPDFADFASEDGPATFNFTEGADGLEITLAPDETVLYRVNAGNTVAAIDGGIDWVGDNGLSGTPTGGVTMTGNKAATFQNALTDAEGEMDFDNVDPGLVPWDLFVDERGQGGTEYTFAVTVGNTYKIEYFYTENWNGIFEGGPREFDVSVEGQVPEAFENLNPLAEAQAFVGTPAPTSNGASDAEKQPYLGVARKAEFIYTATDDTLNLELINNVQEAKVNAIQITQLSGTFVPPSDITAPVIEEITLENLLNVQDGVRELTVVVTDETGFDMGNLTGGAGSGITFTGFTPDAVSAPTVVLSAGGRTATLTYQVTGEGEAWLDGTTGEIAIAAGTFTDAGGNASAAATAGYVIQSNLDSLERGAVVRAINMGTTDTTPGDLGPDPEDGGAIDNNRYGGALTDTIITDAYGNFITFEADSNAYHTSPKASLNANVDGQSGGTGSNSGGIDLDGSAYHTYRDSQATDWTSTFTGFANGSYIVELHFAELFASTEATARIGDFTVNGRLIPAAEDYNAFASAQGGAGADKPSFIRVPVTVTDGTITLDVHSDRGQAAYSAIVVYDAVDSSAPASVSVGDATVVEGDMAEVTFTRTGDLSEAVTIEYSVAAGTADTSEFGAASPSPVVIAAGQATATVTFQINDDSETEDAETITVTIDSATVPSTDPVTIADATATVTIAASDSPFQADVGTAIFDMDFQGVTGEVLAVTGFDGTLGDEAFTLDEATSEIENGKLVVNTAEGDINDGTNNQNASINDFTKTVDVSDPALTELYLTARFDNPFTEEEFASQGITDGRLPNYVQQGIVFGTGTQLAGEMIKLVWGGVAGAPAAVDALGIQMWSKGSGGVNQQVLFTDMVSAGVSQFDVASIELSMVIDKAAGTVGQYVTLFDATGAVLGGVRPEPTDGFVTAPPAAMTQAVLDNLVSTTTPTHFGVTSSDNSNPAEDTFQSFEATWDVVNLSSPQYTAVEGTDTAGGVLYGDFSDDGSNPTDVPVLQNGDNVIVGTQQGDSAEGGRDRDYFTIEVPEGQVLSSIILDGYDVAGGTDNQGFIGIQVGDAVTTNPTTYENVGDLLGGLIYGDGNLNLDILAEMAEGGNQQGVDFPGFDLPLGAGTYTIWLNQGGDFASTATLNFQLADAGPNITVSVAAPADVVEAGDFGTTELTFELTASDNFTGDLTITYDTATATGETATVSFVEGAGALTLSVDNDNEDNGADQISVTLTGASNDSGTLTVAVDGTPASAQVTEDDNVAPTYEKGAFVFGVNAGNDGAVTDTSGNTFDAAIATEWSSQSNYAPNSADAVDFTGDGVDNADDTVYESEYYGAEQADLTFTRGGIPAGQYILTIKLAEIFQNITGTDGGVGQRVFDLVVNGVQIADDLDLIVEAGVETAYDIDVPVTIMDEGDGFGTLTVTGAPEIENAKINALALFEAVEVVEGEATVSVADITVSEGDGFADVVFTRAGDTTEAITITYEVADDTAEAGVDYTAPATNTITIAAGETSATLAIELLEDDVEEATQGFSVTITDAASAGPVQLGNATASVTIEDNDLPFGFAPDQDLDQDGIVNTLDDDVDGDGVANGDETFSYDATNAGTALRSGESVTLDFDTDGTPFQNGLTGALWSPNSQAEEVNLGTAEVSDGTLNIEVNKGDHYKTNNNQENALVAAFTAAEGLSVETRFAIPDFDNTTDGVQGSVNPQSAGVVIGTDQNNLIKAVFGRQGGGFELAQDNFADNGNGNGNSFIDPLPEGAAEVSIRLEVFLDETGAAMARAFYTYYDANGAIAGYEDQPFLTSNTNRTPVVRTIVDNATGGTSLKTLIESGAPLGAGVVQTSTGGSTPAGFDVSYQYLTVTAATLPPALISIGADVTAVEGGDVDTTTLSFELIQQGDQQEENVTVDFTVNGEAQTQDVTFVDGIARLSVSFADDEIDNGTETFDIVLTGVTGNNVALGDATEAAGTITEDDAAPVVDQGITAQQTDEDAAFTFAVPEDAFADLDTPDLALSATLADGSDLPAWLSFDGTTFSGTPENGDVGEITVRVTASDGVNTNVFADFAITVFNVNDIPTATAIAVPSVLETDGAVTIDLLGDADATDGDGDILAVTDVTVTTPSGETVAFDLDITGQILTIDPAQFAQLLEDGVNLALTVDYTITDNNGGTVANTATLLVGGVDGPFTWYTDADGDGFGAFTGTPVVSYTQPLDSVLADDDNLDADDADDTIYPGAPELNDGKDNDQDGEVDETNEAPVATPDAFTIQRDTAISIDPLTLLANDTDANEDTLELAEVGNAVGGTVEIVEGEIVFTPTAGTTGTASFDYTVIDGFGGSSTATVTIDVENRIVVGEGDPAPTGTEGQDVVAFDGAGDLDLSDPSIEDVDLSGNANDGGTVTMNDSDNVVTSGTGKQTVNLGGGSDTVTGNASQLDGDTIGDFGEDDVIVLEGAAGASIVSRTNGSAIIGIDTDGDGVADTTLTFTGDVEGQQIVLSDDGTNVTLSLDPTALNDYDVLEDNEPLVIDLAAGLDGVASVAVTSVIDANGAPVTVGDLVGTAITLDPAQFAEELDTGESIAVTVNYTTTDGGGVETSRSSALTVGGLDGPFTFYRDADGDGFGAETDTTEAYVAPDGYVAASTETFTDSLTSFDTDDTDATVYPDAPELRDGKDNDQDGEVDEDNTGPITGDDSAAATIDTVYRVTRTELMSNDIDPDGDPLTFVGVSNAVNGTVTLNTTTGIVSFTPAAGFTGAASFDYTVSDSLGATSVQTVTLDVTRDLTVDPVILGAERDYGYRASDRDAQNSPDYDGTTVAAEGDGVTLTENGWRKFALGENRVITENTELWVTLKASPITEIIGIGFDSDINVYSQSNQKIFQLGGTQIFDQLDQSMRTYTTAGAEVEYKISLGAFAGKTLDNLVFINDQDSGIPHTTVFSNLAFVEAGSANTRAIASEDRFVMEGDAPLVVLASELLANDTDAEGDSFTLQSVGNAQNGTVSFEGGRITFTAAEGYTGPAAYEYTIVDGQGVPSTTTVFLTVMEPGSGDVVTDIDFSANPITSYDVQDTKPGRGAVIVGDEGEGIELTGNVWKKTALTDGTYTVTANTVLRVDFTILAGNGEILAIGLENDNSFENNNNALFQLAGYQDFREFSNQEYRGLQGATGETVSYEISLADYAGQDFTLLTMVNDDDSQGTSKIRFENVQLVEVIAGGGTDTEVPQIAGGALPDMVLLEDQPIEIALPIFDPDTPLEDLAVTFDGLPAYASYSNGVIVGTPTNADVGTATVTVTATDPDGNFVTDTFDLTVQNVNDAPIVTGNLDPAEVVLNAEFTLPLPPDLFTDVDTGDVLTYTATGLPAGVTIDPTTGEIFGTPTESRSQPYIVTVTASDGDAEVSTALSLKVLSGPPRETVTIEAESFTAITEGDAAYTGFYTEFVGPASNRNVIRLAVDGQGSVSTDLDSAGTVPGLYDISVVYLDEDDGVATISVLLDTGDGAPQLLTTFDLDRTDLPGQGPFLEAGNITEMTIPSVDVPAGARLVLQGQSGDLEVARIDLVRLTPVSNQAPQIQSATTVATAENAVEVQTVVATDAEDQAITYAITDTGVDGDLFAIDAATGELSFIAAPDFETPADLDGDNVYEVSVAASDGNASDEQLISVTVENANDAPTATALLEDATAGVNQPIDLPTLAELFVDQDLDALTITATGLPAGVSIVDGAFTGTPTEQGNYTIELTANDGTVQTVASFDLSVVVDFGAVSPDEDLDGDLVPNATDPDVDDDGVANADDPFAYDADDGMLLGAGENRFYGFDIDGTIFENGMTGFLQGTANGGAFNEDTGATSVSGGLLTVNPVTGGDTGTLNTPEDDAVVGVKNGTFTAKAVVLNPWVGAAPNPGGFDQLGLVVGLNSADMIKLVFGQTAGVVEFQKQEADAGTKYGGAANANVALPAGVTLDNFDRAEITFDVISTDATAASVTGSIVFLNDDGTVVGSLDLGAAPIGGALAAALADDTTGVGVGFTHVDAAASPGFVAQMDSLEIMTPEEDTGGNGNTGDDAVVYRINAGGALVAANDGGPAWVEDSIAAPLQYLTVTDNRGDAPAAGYTGDPSAIPVSLPESVLDTARSSDGVFSYDIPVDLLGGGENYEIRLYIAELFEGAQGGDFRNFDASLEGFPTAAFNNIDPGALFGADVGVLTAQVKVTDGVLNIGFAQDIQQNPIINGIEIVALSTDVENPDPTVDPASAIEAFDAQDDLARTETYGSGAIGSAVLEVMTGQNNVQASNFGANSFEVQNTGDKKISAVFIDVSSALYQDSVFDPDGLGGDNAAKPWQINSDGNTGAFIDGSGYFLPGVDPIPNSGGSGGNSNGGYKGAMVKFSATADGGFTNGETVGFSGDMDPNSIAGMAKSDVDGTAILSWDVGGISGHELIGSLFTVLFDDGTTASGQLASDGSSAGSQALATQDTSLQGTAPGIAINGNLPGENGTYGNDVLPTITVTGDPGDRVQITMTKGFNPVTETDNGIVDIVEARLDRYDFKASNAFDAQTVVVTIGADGTFDASTLFDYDDAVNNNVGSGTFAGDDVAQIGFVATKVAGNAGSLPISATTAPIYLTNEGGPVTGDATGGTGGGANGYFAANGSDDNAFFKIQIEDENGTGGTNPGGKWSYLTGPDELGNQNGSQGGYYLFGSETSLAIDNNVGGNEMLEYTIFVDENQVGTYNFSFVVSRDDDRLSNGEAIPSDQQNDIWLNFKHAEDAGNGDIEEFLSGNGANDAEPTSGGFIKLFGGSQNGNWSSANGIDGAPGNFGAQISITEAGLYTIQVEGRSQGYHVDYFELYKGSNPGAGSANSAFIEGEPGDTGGGTPAAGTVIIPLDSAADDWEERGGAASNDLELGQNGGPQYVGVRFDDIDIPAGSVLSEAYIRFTALETTSGTANFTIRIEDDETAAAYTNASQPGARTYTDDGFVWNAEDWTADNQYDTVDVSSLITDLIGADGVEDGAFGFLIEPINTDASRVAYTFGSGNEAELVLVFEDDPFAI